MLADDVDDVIQTRGDLTEPLVDGLEPPVDREEARLDTPTCLRELKVRLCHASGEIGECEVRSIDTFVHAGKLFVNASKAGGRSLLESHDRLPHVAKLVLEPFE